MAVDKLAKYTADVGTEVQVGLESKAKTSQKTRLSSKIFSITMMGSSAIIIFDGLNNAPKDPVWALTCILIGIPITAYGLYELFHGKR